MVAVTSTAETMPGSRRGPLLFLIAAIALAVLPPATKLAYLLLNGEEWWYPLLFDDAYYYFGVARSIVEGDGSTFTGLVETNGYHPLWQLLLVPLAWVARTPQQMVVAVILVHGAIWAGVVHQALKIGRLIGSTVGAVAAVPALGVLTALTFHMSFNGMESALLILLLLATVRLALAPVGSPARDLRFGVLLALICLTRLDATLIAVPLGLVVLLRERPRSSELVRRAVAIGGPAALAISGYLALNFALFGTPTPVSGRAKGLSPPYFNTRPLEQFLQSGNAVDRPLWFGLAALSLFGFACLMGSWRDEAVTRHLVQLTGAMVVGQVLVTSYQVFGTSYGILPWYHYTTPMVAFGSTLLIFKWIEAKHQLVAQSLVVVGVSCFLVVQGVGTFIARDTTHRGGVAAAEFVNAELEDDAVLAMGDRAGIFGYLADQPLLQLEGLMADADFLDDLRDGRATERMIAEGVDYYARYSPASNGQALGEHCWTFEEPRPSSETYLEVNVCWEDLVYSKTVDGQRFSIWRFRPELNS